MYLLESTQAWFLCLVDKWEKERNTFKDNGQNQLRGI
jgi:hypothetical protein